MSGIDKISNEEIERVLDGNVRQYLVGELARPQQLAHISDSDVEVGISHYKFFTADTPHIHREVTEYQMMLSGYSVIKDLSTDGETVLRQGDFFVVHRGTPYAQKSAAGTSILFFKYPGVNDKEVIAVDDVMETWLKEEL